MFMKSHIHTIPVIDALKDATCCPFCTMYKTLDDDAVNFIMGPAYMDEKIRDKTNELGFCENHLQKLYGVQNRLGLALMLHTHLQKLQKDLSQNKAVAKNTCYLCEKIDDTFNRYMDTFLHLWQKEDEVKQLVSSLPVGFCLPHYSVMMSMAEKVLNKTFKKKQFDEFKLAVTAVQQRAMDKLEGDLDWFIQKFDYRNADAPWKDSKDAIVRAMAMLKGIEE